MARFSVDSRCAESVRRVRHIIAEHLGADAAVVFGEAIANVREHSDDGHAWVLLHTTGFDVTNRCRHPVRHRTHKPSGEGGYGLGIMKELGASVACRGRETRISWRAT